MYYWVALGKGEGTVHWGHSLKMISGLAYESVQVQAYDPELGAGV